MKIAFYGDSFSDENKNEKSWPVLLSKKLNASRTNYSIEASDIYFSYNNFLENYKDYDLNIFVATSLRRTSWFKRKNHKHTHIWTSRFDLTDCIKYNKEKFNYSLSNLDKKLLKLKIREFAEYPDNDLLNHLAIYDSIKYKDNNVILLNAFQEPYNTSNLSNIRMIDYDYHKLDGFYLEDTSLRPCHMSLEQNELLALYLYKHINGKANIYDILEKTNVGDYFKPTKEFSETGFVDQWKKF